MPVIVLSLPESNGGGVVLTQSKVLCVGKLIFHKPEFFNYADTNEYVLATEEELTKAPWDTMNVTPNLRAKACSMKFARPFVKLSERATHVKDIQWSDDLVTPRLSWLCKYLPKVWKKLDQEARQLAFLMGTHARLGQGARVGGLDNEMLMLIYGHVLAYQSREPRDRSH